MKFILKLLAWVLFILSLPRVLLGATSIARYADIAALVNDIYEGALFTLRSQNLLARTVTVFRDQAGLQPRKPTVYGQSNFRERAEGQDTTPTELERSLLATITPAIYSDAFALTDQRVRTDPQNVRGDAAMELGMGAATLVDQKIAANFTDLTGGSRGTAGSALTFAHVMRAKALLAQGNVPGPYYAVLGEGMWERMLEDAGLDGGAFQQSPLFQNELVQNYYISPKFGGLTFIVSNNVDGAATGTATGAVYSPSALAYDERMPFTIEPERTAGKTTWTLYANLEFAADTWAAARGVKLIGTDIIL